MAMHTVFKLLTPCHSVLSSEQEKSPMAGTQGQSTEPRASQVMASFFLSFFFQVEDS